MKKKMVVNDLSNVKFTNENDEKKALPESTTVRPEDVPSVSFITLFRFASTTDKVFIVLSMIFSIIGGTSAPLNAILFADLMQAMVNYGISLAMGTPGVSAFEEAVRDFAIYNSIVGAVLVVLTYAATVMMNMAAYNQVYRIRQAYLKAALNQDFAYFDTNQTGDFASKMTDDVVKLEDGIGEKLGNFVFYQSCFFSAVIMAFIRGWKLALISLASFPVTLFLVGLAGLIAANLSKKEAVSTGKAGAVAEEVLSSIRTIFAFSGQSKELERYEGFLKQSRKINIKKGLFTGMSMGFLFFCIFGAYALSFWFGYQLIIDPTENYDTAIMISVFFGVLQGSANFGISSTLMEVFGIAKGAGAQIFNLIDNVPTINPQLDNGIRPETVEGNIVFKNVKFHYPSRPDVPVLKGITLNVKRGQSVALVGHSGCGKSTIIQLISRYYDTIEGSVSLDGNNVADLSIRWLREQIGLVGQEPVLFNTTIRENIRYGRDDASDADIEAAARQANAHQFVMNLPKGYDTLVGERGASLSGGQKQRIAIARALVRNPRILLLDEATSALDTASESKVQQALDKAQEGRTTIIVAHRLSTIRNVDLIYVFKAGEIIEIGNHEELIKKKGHYYDLVMLQEFPIDNERKDGSKTLTREMSVISASEDEDDFIPIEKEKQPDDIDDSPPVSFWRVLKLSRPEWKSLTVACFCSLLSGFALPVLAIVLGDFANVLSNPDIVAALAEVRNFCFIFVGVGVLSGITNFIQISLYFYAGEYLTERLRKSLFHHLLQQEVAFFDDKNNATGALCARLAGEAASVQGATGQRIGTVLQAIGTFGFALVLALLYEWRVGLVSLVFVPVLAIILYKQNKMARAESFGTAKTMEMSSKIAVEAVSNARTVASLGKEDYFIEQYAIQLLPALKLAKKAAHWRGIVFGLSRGIFNFIYAVSLFYGGTLIVNEGIDYASVLKSAQSLLMGATSSAQAFAFAPSFQKGIKAAGRIILLLSRESNITDPDLPAKDDFEGKGEASLQRVQFKYPTRPLIQVLNGLSLDVERGKTIALVGASGCGKSTVIQLLQRYYDPDSGTVAQDGVPLTKLRLVDVRKAIGFVQQEPILFDRTISENIAYGDNSRNVDMDEIVEVAKQANIHNFITSLPLGYDTNIGSKGTQLSGGQKQRVAIARALIRRPKMLLLDEATSALDTESEKVVQEALDAAKAGRTCVMIAHRLSTVKDADIICVIHEGAVAEQGTHSELLDRKGLYYRLNRRGHS